MPTSSPDGSLQGYSLSIKIGTWDPMCWPTYLTSNPQENLDDLEFPMKLSKNLPKLPLILIFEIRPNDLQDRHGSPKCSKTSTGSFPLSLQPNLKCTTQPPTTQPDIDDGDEL